jgi:hypothetical protein
LYRIFEECDETCELRLHLRLEVTSDFRRAKLDSIAFKHDISLHDGVGPHAIDISITSHACSTLSLCAVLRHRIFKLGTSGMIPIIVKATRNTDAAA